MRYVIEFTETGKVAGRMSIGEPLGPVADPFAYTFSEDEVGLAERLAENLVPLHGATRVRAL